jgi:hypothetical protein
MWHADQEQGVCVTLRQRTVQRATKYCMKIFSISKQATSKRGSSGSSPVMVVACRFPIMFFIVCIILLAYVKLNSCSSYIEAWLTLLPMMIVMTVVSVVAAYIFEPTVSGHPAVRVYLTMKVVVAQDAQCRHPHTLQLRGD